MGNIWVKQSLPAEGIGNIDPFLLLHHAGPFEIKPGSNHRKILGTTEGTVDSIRQRIQTIDQCFWRIGVQAFDFNIDKTQVPQQKVDQGGGNRVAVGGGRDKRCGCPPAHFPGWGFHK